MPHICGHRNNSFHQWCRLLFRNRSPSCKIWRLISIMPSNSGHKWPPQTSPEPEKVRHHKVANPGSHRVVKTIHIRPQSRAETIAKQSPLVTMDPSKEPSLSSPYSPLLRAHGRSPMSVSRMPCCPLYERLTSARSLAWLSCVLRLSPNLRGWHARSASFRLYFRRVIEPLFLRAPFCLLFTFWHLSSGFAFSMSN